jgi:hypothetical protein
MNQEEIIFFKVDNTKIQYQLIKEAIDYALLSIPFTFDRLGNRNLMKNIINITKGKFAENYFFLYCEVNSLSIDLNSVTTPFYQADKHDFVFKNLEWDIKNNYLEHYGSTLSSNDYLDQLALIPNRGPWDQWSKRNIFNEDIASGNGYLFTFMKKSEPNSRINWLTIDMNLAQKNYLLDLYEKYKGRHQDDEPYKRETFWEEFFSLGPDFTFDIHDFPTFVITGIALKDDLVKFSPVKPSEMNSIYMRTIIENMGLKIKYLRSFKEFVN